MATIEIDFEVFKELTNRRSDENVTYNDVIRILLGLNKRKVGSVQSKSSASSSTSADVDAWHTKGIIFPVGSEFRASYKGKPFFGKVESGALVVNSKRYHSPSAAAVAITGNSVNGWVFWECRLPGLSHWQSIKALRKAM